MSFFEAPITLAGFAALSVLTQKKRSGGAASRASSRPTVSITLVWSIASIEYRSFSLRTCLWAAKSATMSNGPSAASSRSNVRVPSATG